ncbi:MAG: hypothetical protein GWO28_15435 [candidate division Zixibacteria bacterium]|nr:hypothetical protein [candidate division Zixibacteria bacterium]
MAENGKGEKKIVMADHPKKIKIGTMIYLLGNLIGFSASQYFNHPSRIIVKIANNLKILTLSPSGKIKGS